MRNETYSWQSDLTLYQERLSTIITDNNRNAWVINDTFVKVEKSGVTMRFKLGPENWSMA